MLKLNAAKPLTPSRAGHKVRPSSPHSSHIAELSTVLGVAKLSRGSPAPGFNFHYKAKIAKIASIFTFESLL